MRILHILAPARFGGVESVVGRLSAGFLHRGHDVRVAAVLEPDAHDHPFVDEVVSSGVTVERVKVSRRAYHAEVVRLRELLASATPDVVHTHGYRGDVIGGTVAKWCDIPVVSTVHGFVGGDLKNRIYEHIQRWSLRRFDRVVGVSRKLAESLIRDGVPSSRVRVVRNAWHGHDDLLERREARERLGVDRCRFLIGWVGRISREKGPDVFLDALAAANMQGVTASIIGDGAAKDSLIGCTPEVSSGVEIIWHERIPQAYRLFSGFDVFVISSRTEGTPMVLLEAMAAGVPVVATRVGGVPDVVSEREAWLVPPEEPAALTRAIEEVKQNPSEAGKRAGAAKERLKEEFGTDGWLTQYERVYQEAVQSEVEGSGR